MNWFELSVKSRANESVPVSLPTIYSIFGKYLIVSSSGISYGLICCFMRLEAKRSGHYGFLSYNEQVCRQQRSMLYKFNCLYFDVRNFLTTGNDVLNVYSVLTLYIFVIFTVLATVFLDLSSLCSNTRVFVQFVLIKQS